MDRVANSTPIVDLDSRLNSFLVNRDNRLDLPTPESPIRTTGEQIIFKQDQEQSYNAFFQNLASLAWLHDDNGGVQAIQLSQ